MLLSYIPCQFRDCEFEGRETVQWLGNTPSTWPDAALISGTTWSPEHRQVQL